MQQAVSHTTDYINLRTYSSEFVDIGLPEVDDPLQHNVSVQSQHDALVVLSESTEEADTNTISPIHNTCSLITNKVVPFKPNKSTNMRSPVNNSEYNAAATSKETSNNTHTSEGTVALKTLKSSDPFSNADHEFLEVARSALLCSAVPPMSQGIHYDLTDDYGLSTFSEYHLPRQPSPYMPSGVRKPTPANTLTYGPQIRQDDLLIDISVYHRTTGRKHLSVQVYNRQCLCSLRDLIVCAGDKPRSGNLQGNSAYFFIERNFYSDMRSPDAVDYSIPVLQWLKETTTDRANSGNHQGEALGSFKMEDHTFADLSVRLGVQYRFVHQGQCEHVLKFERVRVAGSLWKQPTDGDGNMFRYEMNYPVTTYTLKPRAQKCGVCTLYAAKYAVHDSAILIETPAFLCEICFDSLHRDASGNIILEVGPKFQVESFP